jgi:AAA domain
MKQIPKPKASPPTVLSLAELLEQQPPTPPPALVEPGLLPAQGIWFVGGEPKVGTSLLVANLALALAAGSHRIGFPVPAPRRVLVCQFELPLPQFVSRLLVMRRALGSAADQHLLVDTRATGHLLSAPQGLNHFIVAARAASAEVIVLDPLYSTHDQDENDTRAMAALCQALLRLRDATHAALIVVHHTRKSITREEIGSAFRGSSALHAVGDTYMLLTRPSPQLPTLAIAKLSTSSAESLSNIGGIYLVARLPNLSFSDHAVFQKHSVIRFPAMVVCLGRIGCGHSPPHLSGHSNPRNPRQGAPNSRSKKNSAC